MSRLDARRCSRAATPIGTLVWLRGAHDTTTMVALCTTIARAIAVDETDLVIDLSEVTFMDAATVAVIIRAEAFLRDRSRSLTLRSPSTPARRAKPPNCTARLIATASVKVEN